MITKQKDKGFSLIELLIVVAIIVIIAAIAIPNLLRARMAANEASAVGSMRTINTSAVTYSSTWGVQYPTSQSWAVGACTGFQSFTIIGVPATVGQTGQRGFFSDPSGVIRFNTTGAAPTLASPPLQGVGSFQGISERGRLSYPLFSWARSSPRNLQHKPTCQNSRSDPAPSKDDFHLGRTCVVFRRLSTQRTSIPTFSDISVLARFQSLESRLLTALQTVKNRHELGLRDSCSKRQVRSGDGTASHPSDNAGYT